MTNEGRTARINCRTTPAEKAALTALAKRRGRSVSDVMRRLIQWGTRGEGLLREEPDDESPT